MGWVLNASHEVDSQSKYPTIIPVCVVLTFLMTGVVLLRIYIRLSARQIGADDYVIIVTMIFAILYAALAITQTRYGLGLPLMLRPKQNLGTYLKVNFAGRPFYQIGIAGFKLALCISYGRLLSGSDKSAYRYLIWAVAAVLSLGHVAGAFVLIFNCAPVSKSWEPRSKGSCLPFGPTNYALAGFTIACDVIVIVLPIPLLLKLQMKPWRKAVLCGLFLLGLFTTFCSIQRLLQIKVIAYGDGNSTMLVLWGTIEFNVGIMISSVPFLAPLIKKYLVKVRSRISNRYPSKSPNKNRNISYPMYYLSSPGGTGRQGRRDLQHSTETKFTTNRSRTSSEEQILRDAQMEEGVIQKTIEYRVSVSSRPGTQNFQPAVMGTKSRQPVL